MELSADDRTNGYLALFDDRTRDAHMAALIDARCNEPSRWPTVEIVNKIARLFEVPVAEFGAFFGLMLQSESGREVWVDVIRSPDNAWLAPPEHLSRGQTVALECMRMLVNG